MDWQLVAIYFTVKSTDIFAVYRNKKETCNIQWSILDVCGGKPRGSLKMFIFDTFVSPKGNICQNLYQNVIIIT